MLAASGLLFTQPVAGPALTQVSADPFTNTGTQHATEVEPDIFSFGGTIVGAFQVGRSFIAGSSDLGWAMSSNNGATWRHGVLPGLTKHAGGGKFGTVSDPSVVFDAKFKTWMISGLEVGKGDFGAGVSVSRSADGLHWIKPVMAISAPKTSYDKDWITCDNHPASPHYGNCYVEVDIDSKADNVVMSTSTDGGATWSAQQPPAGNPSGLGGQPLVQPSGKVIVPFLSLSNSASIAAFSSANGGRTWSRVATISRLRNHGAPMRDGEGLPSAAIDAAGRVYVVWQDCQFRAHCSADDIVLSTSVNGTTWSKVERIPIDPVSSGVEHLIPGIGVEGAGKTASLAVYYFFLPKAKCKVAACRLEVGYISSINGGQTWAKPTTIAGPMKLTELANTDQGRMVGDYLACTVTDHRAFAFFAVGKPAAGGRAFNEAMYTAGGLQIKGGKAKAVTGPIRPGRPTTPGLSATVK
jgi:hypothetical protein